MREIKSLPIEVKSLTDAGEFEGIASVFGNVDLGGDIMESGAFTKTIRERGNKRRLLDSHKVRIGIAEVNETPYGIPVKGIINLEKQAGRDAYSDLKFYENKGFPMGMSIGYETIRADTDTKGIRHLREVKLWEVTVTEFPMNERATVMSVKSLQGLMDQVNEMKAIAGTFSDEDKAAALALVDDLLAMTGMSDSEIKEFKVGRMVSATNQKQLQAAHDHITSAADAIYPLLNCDAEADTGKSAVGITSKSEAGSPELKPAPVTDHSAIEAFLDKLKGAVCSSNPN